MYTNSMESFGWANKCNFKQVSIHQAAFKACTPQGIMSHLFTRRVWAAGVGGSHHRLDLRSLPLQPPLHLPRPDQEVPRQDRQLSHPPPAGHPGQEHLPRRPAGQDQL